MKRLDAPLIEAPVPDDLAILLKPGFVGTVTVSAPGAVPMVSATADVWPFVAIGSLAAFGKDEAP